jgi:putative transposase
VASPTIHYPGAVYHVMLRGNRKQSIFEETGDYVGFERRVSKSLHLHEARCHAYCWMPNHVHLLIQVSNDPLHRVVHHFATTYAGWFNRKYGYVGHLFQGRFLASHVADDAYLLQAARYIHLNPVAAEIAEDPSDFRWSSYRAFVHRTPCSFLTTGLVLSLFGEDRDSAVRAFRTFHAAEDTYVPAWNDHDDGSMDDVGTAPPRSSLEDLVREATRRFGLSETKLVGESRDATARKARLWVAGQALEVGGATQAEVARRLGRTPQALGQLLHRARRRGRL